jgi:hypothetical protein
MSYDERGVWQVDKHIPYQIVEVKEYQCSRCGYKWIARKNGVDKPTPKTCSKCKTALWDKSPIRETNKVVSAEQQTQTYYTWKNLMYDEELRRYRLRNSSLISK